MHLPTLVFRLKSVMLYYLRAQTKYNIQSPFLHKFLEEVFDTTSHYYAFDNIEKIRKELLKSKEKVSKADYGAGSFAPDLTDKIAVSKIARFSLSSPSQCQSLFRLTLHSKPEYTLELGTSLGISTAYLASANRNAKVFTLEGNPQIADKAREVFSRAGLPNITITTGEFQKTLTGVLNTIPVVNLAFLDGHHDEKATLLYFEQILEKCTSDSTLVIDDIYWSAGMQNAWEKIKAHPRVTLTVDVFTMGLVFINPALSKEHITLIDYYKKPWRIGLFGK
jgi:predicted O-methyltransferase YrrM